MRLLACLALPLAIACGRGGSATAPVERLGGGLPAQTSAAEQYLFRLGSYRTSSLASWVTDLSQGGPVTRTPEGYFLGGDRIDFYGWLDPVLFPSDPFWLSQGREKVRGEAEDLKRRARMPKLTPEECGRALESARGFSAPSADQLAATLFSLTAHASGQIDCPVESVRAVHSAGIGLEPYALRALGCDVLQPSMLIPASQSNRQPWGQLFSRNPDLSMVLCLARDELGDPAVAHLLEEARYPRAERLFRLRAFRLSASQVPELRERAFDAYQGTLFGASTELERLEAYRGLIELGGSDALSVFGHGLANDGLSGKLVAILREEEVLSEETLEGLIALEKRIGPAEAARRVDIHRYLAWADARAGNTSSVKSALRRAKHQWKPHIEPGDPSAGRGVADPGGSTQPER